jgi:hypothetical protein
LSFRESFSTVKMFDVEAEPENIINRARKHNYLNSYKLIIKDIY